MYKLSVPLILYFCSANLSAQNVEMVGAVSSNKYYDLSKDDGHFITDYEHKAGFAISLSVEDTLFKSFHGKLVLTLDNYNGSIYTTNGGLGSSSTTAADVKKTVIGLDAYPANFKIGKIVWLNFGMSFNYLISTKLSGYHRSWYGTTGGVETEFASLDTSANDYVNKLTLGLTLRVAPEIMISKRVALLPQYLIRVGLSNEFRNVEANIKSLRQYLGIGIMRRW